MRIEQDGEEEGDHKISHRRCVANNKYLCLMEYPLEIMIFPRNAAGLSCGFYCPT